jgi:tyrosine-protein kinase Etk/Wzc
MNEFQGTGPNAAVQSDESGFGMMELLIVFAKRKKLIFGLPIAVAIIAAAISMVLPKTYLASVKLLPPQQAQSGAAALLSQLGGIASLAGGSGALKNPNDMYVAMLKSRTVADRLIAQFDLKQHYDADSFVDTRRTLEDNTVVTSGKDGLITISVEDKNPQLVAKIANAYVNELVKLTTVLAVTESSQRRKFFEKQLELSKNNLVAAEMKLKESLDTNGVISVDSDSRAILETVARLRAQISAKEVQLGSMRAFATTNNPDYRRDQQELASLRSELSKLENGRAPGAAQGNERDNMPGLANIQTLRDVKYHQMLYELLAKQFEAARLDEAKDLSLIQILDPAIDPEKKLKPKRVLIVFVATILAGLLSIFLALMLEAKQRSLQLPGGARRWAEFKSHLQFQRAK